MATTGEAVTGFGNGRGIPRARMIVVGATLAAALVSTFAVGRLSAPHREAPAQSPVMIGVPAQDIRPHAPFSLHHHPRVKVG